LIKPINNQSNHYLIVGLLALVLYNNQNDAAILFVGAGFFGATFLDGYYSIVKATCIRPFMPFDSPSLKSDK